MTTPTVTRQTVLINPKAPREAPGQLQHLERGPGAHDNLYFTHPEMVEGLKRELKRMKSAD